MSGVVRGRASRRILLEYLALLFAVGFLEEGLANKALLCRSARPGGTTRVGHPGFLTVDGFFLSFSETLISLLVLLQVFQQRRRHGSGADLFLCYFMAV